MAQVDVFIAGSGPIGCTYARTILDQRPGTTIYMAEVGSQDHPVIGAHHKNSIKYQKDFDAFVNVIKGALQPVSIPPGDTFQSTLARASWAPTTPLVIHGNNPSQSREKNLPATAVTRTVGGMASHWTCSCPQPQEGERTELNNLIRQTELQGLLADASKLLGVNPNEFDISIRHNVIKDILQQHPTFRDRGVTNIPLAVKRRTDNPDYVTWSGCDTILGDQVRNVQLHTETRVTKLNFDLANNITSATVRNLNTGLNIDVIAKVFVVACGAVGTPQILWNSSITVPAALGCYLSEQSMAFCQVVLKREIVEAIAATTNPVWRAKIDAHRQKYPNDPLPIPFNDPEAQLMIPYHNNFPWHVQIHRDAFSYGAVGPKSDPRVVVDLRFFGKSDIVATNRVAFPSRLAEMSAWEPGTKDTYGMPQATFEVTRTNQDGDRDQRMMKDMTDLANILGGFLPGSYPQFMEPGLAMHITGTTRIGSNPETSVANAESKVHGVSNLWVGGNGCIPDATASNPTRTSVAIAIKGAKAVVAHLNANN